MKRLLSAPLVANLGAWWLESLRADPRSRTQSPYRTLVNCLRVKLGKNPRGKERERGKPSKVVNVIEVAGN
jgi:hypothetical protein